MSVTREVAEATVIDAICGLAANPPRDPNDLETWLKSCAYWLEEFLRTSQNLKRVCGAHALLTDTLTRQAWTHGHLASTAIAQRLNQQL